MLEAGLRGYGHLVILKHNNTVLDGVCPTIRSSLVKEDQNVERRARKSPRWERTADADRVKLHFEVRRQVSLLILRAICQRVKLRLG